MICDQSPRKISVRKVIHGGFQSNLGSNSEPLWGRKYIQKSDEPYSVPVLYSFVICIYSLLWEVLQRNADMKGATLLNLYFRFTSLLH